MEKLDPQLTTADPSTAIEEAITQDTEATEGKLWKVIAHDDNFTTMDFVVLVMVQVFNKPLIFAEAIMWQIHNEGQSVVDALPKPEAEFKVKKATALAQLQGFPFRLTIEPND